MSTESSKLAAAPHPLVMHVVSVSIRVLHEPPFSDKGRCEITAVCRVRNGEEYVGAFDLLREDANYRARTTFLRDVYRFL